MVYIRQPIRGLPIRYKIIKGKKYAYQRVRAWRDVDSGKVCVQDRHLGAVNPIYLKADLTAEIKARQAQVRQQR